MGERWREAQPCNSTGSQRKQGCSGAVLCADEKTEIKNVNPAGSSHATTSTFLISGGVCYFPSFEGLEDL